MARSIRARCVLVAALAMLASPALAQSEAGAEAFRRQEQREQIDRSREERQSDVFLGRARADEPGDLPEEQPCVAVSRIVLSDADRFPWAQGLADR